MVGQFNFPGAGSDANARLARCCLDNRTAVIGIPQAHVVQTGQFVGRAPTWQLRKRVDLHYGAF